MSCGGCRKRQANKNTKYNSEIYKIFGNYKYLTDRQIKTRLGNYKKKYCQGCVYIESCDIAMFFKCKGVEK